MTDDLRPTDLDAAHARPAGVSEEAVAATGKLSEMLERIECARGALYEFHQLMGGSHAVLDDVVGGLRACGEPEWAEHVATEIKESNTLEGRWSFQIVEQFDDVYYGPLKDTERRIRETLTDGRRHVSEAEMNQARRTHGHPDHTAVPPGEPSSGGSPRGLPLAVGHSLRVGSESSSSSSSRAASSVAPASEGTVPVRGWS